MSFWSKGDKKAKNGKKGSKSIIESRSDGDIVHSNTTTSYIRQQSAISQTTEIHTTVFQSFRGTSPFHSETSLTSSAEKSSNASGSSTSLQKYGKIKDPVLHFNVPLAKLPYKSTTNTDALPFSSTPTYKASPPRSAFVSAPLTNISKSPINLNYKSPYNDRRGSLGVTPLSANYSRPSLPNIQQKDNNGEELRNKLTVKVVKSTQFYDDQNQKIPIYPTRSKHRGKALVINNIKFITGNTLRKGAEFDEENVVELFRQMRFEIVKYRNLSKKEMEKKITSFRNDASLKKYDIATIIIMSHGTGKERSDSTEVACTDGELVQTTWITNQFDSELCPHLSGKPKIFIFQCCRGDGTDIQHDAVRFAPPQKPRKLSDMLIAYSTVPGFVSHRDPSTGSWYIQAVCRVFMEHAHDTDVENLLKIVDNKLELVVASGSKQTSSFENRGFKTCYLHPQLHQ